MEDPALPTAVLDALHDLTHAYRHRMRGALQQLQLNLTPNELRVLLFVGHHPQCTHKDLVAHTGADKAQVARMLQQMEDAEWLSRIPHPEDKRSRCLVLSARGLAAFQALRQRRHAVGQQMMAHSSAAEQRQLLGLLRDMCQQLEADGEAAAPSPCTCKKIGKKTAC